LVDIFGVKLSKTIFSCAENKLVLYLLRVQVSFHSVLQYFKGWSHNVTPTAKYIQCLSHVQKLTWVGVSRSAFIS